MQANLDEFSRAALFSLLVNISPKGLDTQFRQLCQSTPIEPVFFCHNNYIYCPALQAARYVGASHLQNWGELQCSTENTETNLNNMVLAWHILQMQHKRSQVATTISTFDTVVSPNYCSSSNGGDCF